MTQSSPPHPDGRALQDLQIRLVRIHPGAWEDAIVCSLSRYSLKNDRLGLESDDFGPVPVYSTLSYAWGPASVTDLILLSGEKWPVTVNLAKALRFVRDAKEPIDIWIDALHERSEQVMLMRDIYSRARGVIVYLGDGQHHRPKKGVSPRPQQQLLQFHGDERDEGHIKTFWDTLSQPKAAPSSYLMFALVRILSDMELGILLASKMSDINSRLIEGITEALRMMMLSPWWQRVWVIQEVVVSDGALVRYGALQAPWKMFAAASRHILSSHHASFSLESSKVLQHFAREVQSFDRLREERRAAGGSHLLPLLQDFSSRRSTDERDKVFGLLGMVIPDQQGLVSTDYTCSVREAYRETAISLIRASGTLSLWCGDLMRKNRKDLQSYVPDWSAVYEEPDRRRARNEIGYSACGSWKLRIIDSQNDYWCFVRQGMEELLTWLELSDNVKLPRNLARHLRKFQSWITMLRHHHESGVEQCDEALEAYAQARENLSKDVSMMEDGFHKLRDTLLVKSTENYASKPAVLDAAAMHFLRKYHSHLWVDPQLFESECDLRNCRGHPCLSKSLADDAALNTLVGEADSVINFFTQCKDRMRRHRAEYLRYPPEGPPSRRANRHCGTNIDAIYSLCERLKDFCAAHGTANWARRLFSRSVAMHGEVEMAAGQAVLFRNPRVHVPDDIPLFADSDCLGEPLIPPSFPILNRTWGRHSEEAIFTISSIYKGTVSSVGPRLLTWSDVESAFTILGQWISVAKKAKTEWKEELQSRDFEKAHRGLLPMDYFESVQCRDKWWDVDNIEDIIPRVLVADAEVMSDKRDLGDSKLSTQIRRLGRDDDVRLQRWYRRIVEMVDNHDHSKFLAEDEMRPLDEAMIIATEGRTMFFTLDSRSARSGLGLGPGSTAFRDSVRIMPGGRTHILLRSLEARASTFTVVGDCFFIDTTDEPDIYGDKTTHDEDREGTKNTDGAWPGWLPEELLPAVAGIPEHFPSCSISEPFETPYNSLERVFLF